MKITKLFLGLSLVFSVNSFAQTLTGGQKNYGIFTSNSSKWFFTQKFSSNSIQRSNYNNNVYYVNKKLDSDINSDGIKDAGDYTLKINNTISKNSIDYFLVTVLGVKDFTGTEVEVYTDCDECISFYKNGKYESFYKMNLFKRYSKVIPANGTEVRTINSLPLLAQIPTSSSKKKFIVEVGIKLKVARKVSCSSNEKSDYQFFPTTGGNSYRALTSENSYYISNNPDCSSSFIKSPDKITTSLANWGSEEVFDKFIVVYTFEL